MKEPKLYKVVRPILKVFMKIAYKPKMSGLENIPREGPVILAGNHTNNFDCLLLIASTKRCIHFLAKDSLYQGWKKVIFKHMGIIPVNRKIHDKSVIPAAEKVLKQNGIVGIFPEGTFNRTKDVVMPFKIGAVKIASDMSCPIVPFAIVGKYKPFKKGLRIFFGKPLQISHDLEYENKRLMNTVSKHIIECKENDYAHH